MALSNEDLIQKAMSVVKSRKNGDFTIGDVGCALLSDGGNIYLGVCIDVACGMGFCAEHNAIGSMVTGGESKIKKIVAVLGDGKVIPPCGRCREFMRQIDQANMETEVILDAEKVVKLSELIPYPW
jgi:cytidine deaminase